MAPVAGSRRPLSTRLIAASRWAGIPVARSAAATAERHSSPWATDLGQDANLRLGAAGAAEHQRRPRTARQKAPHGRILEAKA